MAVHSKVTASKQTLLHQRSATVQLRTALCFTVLIFMSARVLSQCELIQLALLPQLGSSPDRRLDALNFAIEGRDNASVQRILQMRGVDLHRRDDNGHIPLTRAAREGGVVACQLLLENGALPAGTDHHGNTALHYAARTPGARPIVSLLLAYRADVNARGWGDVTPLMYAAMTNHGPVINDLLRAGANLHAVDASGFTALDWAVCYGETETAAVLRRAGANSSARAGDGATPADTGPAPPAPPRSARRAAPRARGTASLTVRDGRE